MIRLRAAKGVLARYVSILRVGADRLLLLYDRGCAGAAASSTAAAADADAQFQHYRRICVRGLGRFAAPARVSERRPRLVPHAAHTSLLSRDGLVRATASRLPSGRDV